MPAPRQQQWMVSGQGFVSLEVIARPGSARRRIVRREPRGLVVEVNSQPSKGRANDELIAFFAELLGTTRSSVTIIRGRTARTKTVRIANPQQTLLSALLQAYP
jgi:uncharacterized protein (TIGR00251 family)